jgi:hypothetical protein
MSWEATIDWTKSIEQQVGEIDALLNTACSLMRQIRDKKDISPHLITDGTYHGFETAICSVHQLIRELEDNPLYRPALLHLCSKQKDQRQRVIEKYFGAAVRAPR